MTIRLRDADPVPTPIDAYSSEADLMLAKILDAPHDAARRRSRKGIGLGIAAAAATAVVAVPAFWPGDRAPSSAQAFSVTRHGDGTVEVRVDPGDFDDPAGLQQALRNEGVDAYVTSREFSAGRQRIDATPATPPECSPYPPLPMDTTQAQRMLRELNGSGGAITLGRTLGEMTLRPGRLPDAGAFVLTADFVAGKLAGFSPGVAVCPD